MDGEEGWKASGRLGRHLYFMVNSWGNRYQGAEWMAGQLQRRTHIYLWQIHFDIRQNQYNIVKLNKIKLKKKKRISAFLGPVPTGAQRGSENKNLLLRKRYYFIHSSKKEREREREREREKLL